MAELKLKRGLASALALEDVEDGSLLFSTDTKKISFDVGNERLQVATGAGAQSDWNETNSSSDAYIKNKPTNVSAFTNDAGYLTSFTESDPTVPSWAKAESKPTYTASEVGLGNVGNFKAVSTVASQGLTSTEQANARANIGAGTSSFDGAYSSLSGTPTLGTAAAKDVATTGNASTSQVVMGNDTRLSDSRNAADVYSWAKASTKPSYTASEVGAVATSGDTASNTVAFTSSDVADGNASSWTSVTTLATGETHASLMAKMSKMFKNIRYLYSLVSTLDGETFIKL